MESVAAIFQDATQMSDELIPTLQCRLFQETKRRSKNERLPSFTLKSDRGEMTCIPVPKHKSDDAFKAYQRKTPYVEHMCTAVGGGNKDVGVQRLLSHLACHHEEAFIKCGQERGLAVSSVMNEVALGAMMDDNNLKLWQLFGVLKHVRHGTGCKISVSAKHLKKFAENMIQPKTGRYVYNYTDSSGNNKREIVQYDYQSVSDMFIHVVSQLLIENNVHMSKVRRVGIVIGGDHGKGAFRLVIRVLILLEEEQVLYKDVGVATIFCSKDSAEIVKNTIYHWLTDDLKLLNESQVILEDDTDTLTKCDLQPTTYAVTNGELCIPIDIFNTGDIKWAAMLAGMENHSGCWCIHCLLSPAQWKVEGHQPGELRDVKSVEDTVKAFNITATTKSDPKFKGVASLPFFPFLKLSYFVGAILHCRIGLFNDIDGDFHEKAGGLVRKTQEELQIRQRIVEFDRRYEDARAKLGVFDASDDGRERERGWCTKRTRHLMKN
jgi:hypothetical protein